MKRFIFAIFIIISVIKVNLKAATITSNVVTGNWNSTTSWVGGIVPGVNDSVVLVNGSNITLNANAVIYKITLNTGSTLNITDKTLSLQGNTILGGNLSIWGTLNLNTGIVQITGNFVCYGTFNCGTGTIIFYGNDAQGIEGSVSPVFYHVWTKNTNGLIGKGVAAYPGNTTIKGNFIADGVFNRNSQSYPDATIIFDGVTHLSGAYSFYLNHVIINAGATVYGGSKNVNLYGNWTSNGTFICEFGNIIAKYDTYSSCQPNSQTIYVANPDLNPFYNLTTDKTSGSISPISGTDNTYGNLYVNNNFNINNGTWNVNGVRRLYVTGNFTVQTNGIFLADLGRVLMTGTNTATPQTLNPGTNNLYKLTIDNSGAGVKLATNITVTYDLTLTNGILFTRNSSINYIVYVSNTDPILSIPSGYSASSYVAGNLKRAIVAPNTYVFPIGNSNSVLHKYRPFTFNLTNAGGASNITVNQDSVENSGSYYASWWAKIVPDAGAPIGTLTCAYNLPIDFQPGMNECSISMCRGTQPPFTSWSYVLTTSTPASGGSNGTFSATLPPTYAPYAYILGEPVPVAANTTICDGNIDTLNITSPTGYGSFNWYTSQTGGTAFLIGNSTYTTPSLFDTTTYYISYVNPQCESHRYPVTVNVNDIPTSTFSTQNPVCYGSSATIAYTGTASISSNYSWNFGGASATPGTGQGPQQLTGTAGQNYNISLIVTQNGCTSASTNGTITIPAPLNLVMSHTNSTCGNNNGSATVAPTGGWGNYTFAWNVLQTTATINNVPSGTYLVTVTDQNGCSQTGTTTVSDVGAPAISANVISNVSCFGGHDAQGGMTATGSGNLTYTWSNGVTGNGNNSVISAIDTLSAGIYNITVTDQNGCQAGSSIIITQPQALSATFTTTNTLCYGQNNGTISSSTSGGTGSHHFAWAQGSSLQNLINLYAGTYFVTINDDNGCTITDSVIVEQPDPISISISEVPITCFASEDGILSAIVSGGTFPYSYLWSNGDTTQISDSLHSGNYFVIISDANGCNTFQNDTLLQPTPIDVTIQSFPVTCYGYADGSVYITVSGGTPLYSYVWTNGATTQNLNPVSADTYWVTITDDNGCTAVASEVVTEPNPLISSVSSVSVRCNGNSDGSILTNIQGGVPPYTYNWNDGYSGPNNTNIPAGDYSLTITDTNGCHDTISVTIDEPALLSSVGSVTHVKCFGESNGNIQLTISGGTVPYSFLWDPLAVSQDIYGLPAGTYNVTITDDNNCTQYQIYIVSQPMLLEATATITNMYCSDINIGSASVSVTGGTPGYLYNWSNGSTNSSLTNLAPGTYFLTITDQYLCLIKDTVIIYGSPTIDVSVSFIVTQGQAIASVNGGSPPFDYIWNTGSTDSLIQNIQTGTYSVTITDQYGCSASASSDVIVEFIIPTVFTPNNDNINDTWEIKGIEAFSEVTIDIFDRWGDKVFYFNGSGFEYKNKNNQWSGEYKGKSLPTTSFIFIVNLHNEKEPITGTVSIVR